MIYQPRRSCLRQTLCSQPPWRRPEIDFLTRARTRVGTDVDGCASRKSSNFLKQPLFLPVSTVRSDCVRWMVWRLEQSIRGDGGDTRRILELSPRLSLRRAKTATPESTLANSLDRG
jgi:hypothetical protein